MPGPSDLPRWSTAPYVAWTGPSAPVRLPLAVFIDAPGGPLDRVAADLDVSTFLNDRFHPWFLTPEAVSGLEHEAPTALILDPGGCVRVGPFRPESASAWISAANQTLRDLKAGVRSDRALPPLRFSFALPPDHPLWGRCAPPTGAE